MRECFKNGAEEAEQQAARRRAKPVAVIDAKALRLKNMRGEIPEAVFLRQAKPKALNPAPPRERPSVTLELIAKKPAPPPINVEVLLRSFALAQTLDGGVF